MDIKNLRYFSAVVEHGSFSRAAEAVYVSQPALSLAIKALEKDLKCRLFLRGREITLTPAGERLRDHARKVFHLLEDLETDLLHLEHGVIGTVRPAILESLLLYVLPEVISEFSFRFPRVQFEFAMLETANIEKAVRNGENHFGLVSRPPKTAGLEVLPLATFPHQLVVSAQRRERLPKLMQSLPLFMLGNWQQEAIEKRTDVLARFPQVQILNPINHVAVVRQLVAKGLGVAILPEYVNGDDLRVLETFPDYPMSVYGIRSPDRITLPAAEQFMQFLQKHLKKRPRRES